jgi:hypothetical protein
MSDWVIYGHGSALDTPFDDETFDLLWCYDSESDSGFRDDSGSV